MKKLISVLIVAKTVFIQCATAQVTQLELASGFYKSGFSAFSIKPLNEKRTISISTLAFFQKFSKKEDFSFDEAGVKATAFWNFSKIVSAGPSLYYNSIAGLSTNLSLLVFHGGQKFTFIAIPSIIYSDKTNTINGEVFLQLQFIQPIKNNWHFLTYTQMLTSWNKFSTHSRSFQQLRLGVSKNNNQLGVATDVDQYGELPIVKTTIGIFVRKVFVDE